FCKGKYVIENVKPTFDEALRAWNCVTMENCSFKSWIKPRFNIWRFKREYYFYYKPLFYKTWEEIKDELFTIFLN
ncbi:unnamed protein product, partial [marine sediment metagenome]